MKTIATRTTITIASSQILVELANFFLDLKRLVVRLLDWLLSGEFALERVDSSLHVAGEGVDLRALDLPHGQG